MPNYMFATIQRLAEGWPPAPLPSSGVLSGTIQTLSYPDEDSLIAAAASVVWPSSVAVTVSTTASGPGQGVSTRQSQTVRFPDFASATAAMQADAAQAPEGQVLGQVTFNVWIDETGTMTRAGWDVAWSQ